MVNYDRDEYVKLIDSSILFSLDRESEHAAYKREALKMVEYLYCYLMSINCQKYEPYGAEIVDTAKRCIENYNKESGRFLNYFSTAWKQTYGHIVGKELMKESFKGIRFTEDEERNFKKYMRLAQTMGIDTETLEFNERVAEAMGLSLDEVDRLRRIVNSKPVSDWYMNEEGEEVSLLDQLDCGNYTDAGILDFESAKEFLDLIEVTYNQLQERQKPMIAILITSKLAMILGEDERLLEYCKEKSFFVEHAFEMIAIQGERIQAKEIAERFGVLEASVSRSWRVFREKLESKRKEISSMEA